MSELPKYPEEDLNRGAQLLAQLGSFWYNIFEDREEMRVHMRSNAHENIQSYLGFMDAVATLSRFTVPIFHKQNWHLLQVKQSESLSVPSVYRAGDLVYGPQPQNGRPAGFIQRYNGTDRTDITQIPFPDELADSRFTIQNTVTMPTKTWIRGIDYDIDAERKLFRFRDNPFTDPAVPSIDIFDSAGNLVDREISLWIYYGEFDLNYIYIHFGYALGLVLESSQGYKDLLNAFWDMHVLGPNVKDLQAFMAALSGNATVLNPSEVVEVVRTETTSKLIVTDLSVYRVPLNANVVVSVGETVYSGDVLTDAVSVSELSGNAWDIASFPALSLSRSFVSGNYLAELTFRNERATVQYLGMDADGKAEFRFEVSGFPGDVDTFWEGVHARGKDQGTTLANYLDKREEPVGEPVPMNLPAEINPMQFIIENLMRNNLFLIHVRLASFGAGAPGIEMFGLLRDVLPPHITYAALVELTPGAEAVDLSLPGGEQESGVEESVGVFLGAGPVADQVYEVSTAPPGSASYDDAFVQVRSVSLTCQ